MALVASAATIGRPFTSLYPVYSFRSAALSSSSLATTNLLHQRGLAGGAGGAGSSLKLHDKRRLRVHAEKDGRELWRRELGMKKDEVDEFELLDEAAVQEEARRLAKKQALEKLQTARYSELLESTTEADDSKGLNIIEVLEKLLVADFFLITIALMWFLTGILQKSISNDPSVLEAWLRLWDPLFQPAIGILMAGALLSGLSKRLKK